MKLKISIPQIFAKKITHPRTNDDEIYVAYFLTLAKKEAKTNDVFIKKYATKKISKIKKHIINNSRWAPEDTETIIDTGDAEALFVTMALYECDDSVIYKKLVSASENVIDSEDFDWSYIELPANLTNWFSWIKSVWKLVVGLFNYLKQDDLLGEFSIVLPLTKEAVDSGYGGLREIKFKQFGGDYRVTLDIETLDA